MSKFSVKKPLTVFVAVIAVLVLGVVAYLKMTPDLLPNMDFPYVMIVTTYPGASPEKVEMEITKPMEQSMSTLEHIKNVSSSSAENVSTVMLEFEEAVNMDTIGVDIQQQISALSAEWEDMVGTPYVLKINPSMLPVEVAGVSMEGMDTVALTQFLEDTLLNKLEGISGVARISTTGMIQQQLHIVLDQKKLDAINEDITASINAKIEEARQELEDQKEQLNSAKGQIASAQGQMNQMKNSITGFADAANATVSSGVERKIQDLTQQIWDLEAAQQELDAIRDEISYVKAEIEIAEEEDLPYLNAELIALQQELVNLESQLWLQGVDPNRIDASISVLEDLIMTADDGLYLVGAAANTVKQVGSAGIGMMAGQIGQGTATIDSAMSQIDAGFDTLEESREKAIRDANIHKIITMEMVTQILTAQNFAMPAGYVQQEDLSYMVSIGDEITDVKTLENLLLLDIGMEGVDPIYLKDVAVVSLTDNRGETYAKLNGRDGVMLSFEKQSTYATAETTNNIAARFRELEQEYPGLSFVSLMDQGDYIYIIVDSILNSLLLGAVFAILVLFVFLKDLRPTFITLCSIPLSVVFAIVLMYFSNVTINMISLSGLAVAVGMLVDNSVVVIENIYRLRAKGANVIQAAVSGAQQVAGAVTASTLTTVCVFAPIVFVEGITRQLFTDLALTMTYALMASLIVSLTLVPAMASGMLRKEHIVKEGFLEKKILPVYKKLSNWSLDHKVIVLSASVVLLLLTGWSVLSRGFIFMPEMDMPSVNVTVSMPEDADMAQATALADQVLAKIESMEGIETVGAMMGSGSLLGGGNQENLSVTIYINLSDQTASGAAVGREIEKLCQGMDCTVTATSAMLDMSMLTGSGITVQIYSDDMQALQDGARETARVLGALDGVGEISDGLEDAAPALHIGIDRNAAMKQGLTVAQVYMELANQLTTDVTAATLQIDGTSTDIIIEKPAEAVPDVKALKEYVFEVKQQDDSIKEVPLDSFAVITETTSLSSISRTGQRRYLTVSADVQSGYNVTLLTAQAETAMEQANLDESVSYVFTGENEAIMDAIEQLMLMLVLGVLLVYLVMVAQFQSLKSPFIVMFTIPLAFTGGFLALMLFHMNMSVISMIGFVMLTGIIVNNGIVLVDYINQLRLEGKDRRTAILEAGVTRMRPILMTTITTVLGLIDMAVRVSAGTALMRPIAIVSIGGLVYATLMTLFVVPCIYDLLNKKELRNIREEDLKLLDL